MAILSRYIVGMAISLIIKTIVFSHRTAEQLDDLPQEDRVAVGNALTAYAIMGRGDVKQLSNRQGSRMRVGRLRMLFDENGTTILAIYSGKRETTTHRRN